MEVRNLVAESSTSPQITAAEAAAVHRARLPATIGNRPGRESDDSPSDPKPTQAASPSAASGRPSRRWPDSAAHIEG